MVSVTLTAEQERIAADAVASGMCGDLGDVVRAGLDLVRRAAAERADFMASLEAAQIEGVRDGFITIEALTQELDAIIAAAERGRA
jgi:Arc/MetJ-type ribon-helix-helix transcriptional regulator